MERFIDLHTHSVMSDGALKPAEVVRLAKEKNLSAVALSDHDSVEGVEEAVAEGQKIGIEVVPAIELSAKCDTELHILGYFIDVKNTHLTNCLEKALIARDERAAETAKKLNALGFDVTLEEAAAIAPAGIIGRAHYARLLADKGYTSSVKESFDLYLSLGKPAYSSNQIFTPEECVEMIKRAGGAAFIAHLHLTKLDDKQLQNLIERLIPCGLDGLEGYYTEYTPEMQEKYQSLAKEYGLIISGGTDFHGAMKPHISIGSGLGNLKIPYDILENVKKIIK